MGLFSAILIPISAPHGFLDLQYKKLKPNIVDFDKNIKISVNSSASPLFFQLKEKTKIKDVLIGGSLEIEKEISDFKNDSYFQLGVIYEGDYKPNSFMKSFLPEWLRKVLEMSGDSGIGSIYFYEISPLGMSKDGKDSIRDIKLYYKTVGHFKKNQFQVVIKPRDEKVLGFWLRSDGDESKAKFKLTLNQLSYKN